MKKTYFHNYKSTNTNLQYIESTPLQDKAQKKIVDINKILNRVKIDKKKENNKKIIFFCSGVLVLVIFGLLLKL